MSGVNRLIFLPVFPKNEESPCSPGVASMGFR
nr:MAG TPA: hypothetical protein [Caudoviricetes sp.]